MSVDQNCIDIELAESDCDTFQIDNPSVLLELRPSSGLYGVFYTAKGLQWDIWSDLLDGDTDRELSYALGDPLAAACELLSHRWRPDFQYEPEE